MSFFLLLCITFQGEQVRYIYNVMPFQKLYIFKILFYLLIIDIPYFHVVKLQYIVTPLINVNLFMISIIESR